MTARKRQHRGAVPDFTGTPANIEEHAAELLASTAVLFADCSTMTAGQLLDWARLLVSGDDADRLAQLVDAGRLARDARRLARL